MIVELFRQLAWMWLKIKIKKLQGDVYKGGDFHNSGLRFKAKSKNASKGGVIENGCLRDHQNQTHDAK